MKICEHCGQQFSPRPQGANRFCGLPCSKASEAAKKPSLECAVCGKNFRLSPRDIGRGQKCCSVACGRAYYRSRLVRTPIEDRFWRLVRKTDGPDNPDGCWLWTGGIARGGYGNLFTERGKPVVMAHKFSYELAYGPVPEGRFVLHKCDTPGCVRPDHLFIGDARINARDCAAKGRIAYGTRQPRAKLNEEQVIEIVQRITRGESHSRIAKDYGVSPTLISNIRTGKVWRRTTRAIIIAR